MAGVRVRLGSVVLCADPAIGIDLSDMAAHHRLDVAGLLGYPALQRSIVTVNYREFAGAHPGQVAAHAILDV